MANIELKDVFINTFNTQNTFSYKDTCLMCVKYDNNGNYSLCTTYIGPGVLSSISAKSRKWDDGATACLSDPDIKVCVRKAIPAYPRRGMYYYFDTGIRFNVADYIASESSPGFKVPSDGEYISFSNGTEENKISAGTEIKYANKSTYFNDENRYLLVKKTTAPCLVKILKDRVSPLEDGAIKITEFTDESNLPNFTGRRNHLDVVNGVVTYKLKKTIPFRCGDIVTVSTGTKTTGYKIFRYAKMHGQRKYYDSDTGKYKNGSDYNDKKRLREVKKWKDKYGCYYLRRYKKISGHPIMYGPVCKCRLDAHGKITRIYNDLTS